MAVVVFTSDYAKDAAANEHPVLDGGRVIDLNPDDWREVETWRANENGPEPDHRTERN